jgi:hypothetical protein
MQTCYDTFTVWTKTRPRDWVCSGSQGTCHWNLQYVPPIKLHNIEGGKNTYKPDNIHMNNRHLDFYRKTTWQFLISRKEANYRAVTRATPEEKDIQNRISMMPIHKMRCRSKCILKLDQPVVKTGSCCCYCYYLQH